ncbi:polymer-forming cytoskeletal protein [Caenimonas sp. SL110]|uniref:bactofilin family protein n=1 Tax=Caenimonas sp. SL110 TaxID=1450524 RepID=UPI0009E30D97|nr:polymer-forming cytoskeletal protein [Caenimonas sp. SL110]
MKSSEDVLTIDPVAMNVVNRIACGTNLAGNLLFEGGVLVQGRLGGDVQVNGRVIVWTGGVIRGKIRVLGDMYVFGQLGELGADPGETMVECLGTLYVANTGVTTGILTAHHLMLYEGADLRGPFTTLRSERSLPVLDDRVAPLHPASPAASSAGFQSGNF